MGTKKQQPQHGDDYVETALKDPSSQMKLKGVREINRSKDISHFRSLIRVFSETDDDNRSRTEQREIVQEIYRIFVALGTFALLELTDALGSTNANIRSAAAQIIGYLGFRQAVPALLKVVGDDSPEVRKNVIRALGRTHCSSNAIESAIITALTDTDPEVAGEAIIASGQLQVKRSIPHLSAILEKIPRRHDLSDIEHDQIFFATRSLGFIGDHSATPVLLTSLQKLVAENGYVPGLLTNGIVDALADLRDIESTKILLQCLEQFEKQQFEITDSDDSDDYDVGDRIWEQESYSDAIVKIKRALCRLDRDADGLIIDEFSNWIKENRDGQSDRIPGDYAHLSARGRYALFRRPFSTPYEAFSWDVIDVLVARGQPVIDNVGVMLQSQYQEVRLAGVQVLAEFAAENETVITMLRELYSSDTENEAIKSVAFSKLLDLEPVKTLELFRANIPKRQRAEIKIGETIAINHAGYSEFEKIARLLSGGRSDADKSKAVELLAAFISDANALVPHESKKNQPLYRRRRNHERAYRR